ncbi:MAG: prohibitin family protein, partial [Chlamydiae bacterium]|nr:prohibitin family protein [Chlamydiota bacterium]
MARDIDVTLRARAKPSFLRTLERNKIFIALLAVPLFVMWVLCFKIISPGYVGVVVDLLGNKKGVEEKPLHVGMHWIAPWKKVYSFPVFEQNDTWQAQEAFFFQTSEGLNVQAEVGITFHLEPEYIPTIFQRYRRGMKEITHTFIRNYMRDAINNEASRLKIEEIYSSKKTEFLVNVQQRVKNDLKELGINITRIYLIDQFHFPQSVVDALNSKIAAIQRAEQRENELREAEAEAKKLVAKAQGDAKCVMIEAEAEARSNELVAKSLTDELIRWQALQKW